MDARNRIRPMTRVLLGLLAVPAAGAAETEAGTGAVLSEVIVTAQKRSENLQDVPISVLAVDAVALEARGIVSLGDINDGSIPGVSLAPYPGSAEFFFPTFRGLTTNTAFISAPNPIAVHVDGVFWSQLVGLNNPAADLERIEILKGPQGVMSGRNATGGAINIFTARPRLGEFRFKEEVSGGNYGQYRSRTIVNVPFGDTFAAKLSYLWLNRDRGEIRNTAPEGVEFGKRHVNAFRFDLRWKPGDDLTVDYGFDRSDAKSYDTPPQCRYPAPSVTALAFTGDPRITAFVNGCSPTKRKELYYPFDLAKNHNLVWGHTLNVEWQVAPALTVRSITGYRIVDTRNEYNYGAYAGAADVRSDSGPLLMIDPNGMLGGARNPFTGESHPVALRNRAVSQELQLLGDVGDTLHYTTGVYWSKERGRQSSGPNVGMYMAAGSGFPGVDFVMVDEKGLHRAKSKSWAAFGQVSWRPDVFGQRLEIVPGIRYTEDDRYADGYNLGWTTGYVVVPTGPGTVMLIAPPVPIAAPDVGYSSAVGRRKFTEFTPSLSLNYHWSDDLMTYAKYSKGYTSGGFDPVSGPGTAAAFSAGFAPEKLESYELGLKGEFVNRRLRVNLALFKSDFTDEQKSVALPSGGWKTENVGGSTYKGLELDVALAVTPELLITGSYSTIDHEYDRWIDPTSGQDVTAKRRLVTPKGDYTIAVNYRFPDFGLPGTLAANVDYSHRSKTSTPLNADVPNVEMMSVTPSFSLLNARLTLSEIAFGGGDRGRFSVALWGRNLTDKNYSTLYYQGWVTAGSASWGEPRTYGLDVRFEY